MNIFTIALVQPLANGLAIFYRLFGSNMGLAIIGFSVFLKFILDPLTRKSLENMKQMNDLRPQLQKLQAKHKGDRQKYMRAQADFYKEKGFNPSAGCLPQIVQIVVLYAFLSIFNQVLKADGQIVDHFNNLLYPPLKFAADTVINTRFLYLDILKPDAFNIAGIPFGIPGPLLILAAIAQFVSAKIMQPFIQKEEKIAKKTPEKSDDAMVMSQQYTILMLPFLTIIFGLRFASGLALYWLVFSLIQTWQQYKIAGAGSLTPFVNKIKTYIRR